MFAFKRLTLASAITFAIVANFTPAKASNCWLRDAAEKMPVPAGEKLKEGGYMCIDHLGAYAQVEGQDREVRLAARGLPRTGEARPRVQIRPTWRTNELISAGIAYPAQDLTQEKRIAQYQAKQ